MGVGGCGWDLYGFAPGYGRRKGCKHSVNIWDRCLGILGVLRQMVQVNLARILVVPLLRDPLLSSPFLANLDGQLGKRLGALCHGGSLRGPASNGDPSQRRVHRGITNEATCCRQRSSLGPVAQHAAAAQARQPPRAAWQGRDSVRLPKASAGARSLPPQLP